MDTRVISRAATDAASGVRPVHQRVDGAAFLELRRADDGVTRVADLYQRAPCRMLFPAAEADEPTLAVLLTTSGGLTGGDRTKVTVIVGQEACATVTTQAAEKIYRALDCDSETQMSLELVVGAQAWAEYLAQETILFDGARLRRTFTADVAEAGRLLALESVVLGRTQMGESFDTGLLHDAWQISRDGRLVWIDAVRLEGDITRLRAQPFGLGTCVAYSTLLYVGADAAARIDCVRATLASSGSHGAATVIDDVLIVRAVSEQAHELRAVMISVACGLRQAAGSWPARLPRVWNC